MEIDRCGGRGGREERRSVLILAKQYGWIHCFNYAGRHALG